MREKLIEFCRGGAPSAAKLVAAIVAAYALYCQFVGKEAKQLDVSQLTILATVLLSIVAAHLDSAKVKAERRATAAVRDERHEQNAARIAELEGTVMTVAAGVQAVAASTGTDINVPPYSPTPPPAVPADRLRDILEKKKAEQP